MKKVLYNEALDVNPAECRTCFAVGLCLYISLAIAVLRLSE